MLVHAQATGFSQRQHVTENKVITTKTKSLNLSKNISKHTHRRGKRNSVKSTQQIFSILGVNADGITGKWSTLKNVLSKHKPLVWNIQETKCVKEGRLKLNGFRVFEYIRSNQDGGGGLALGCSIKLSPVLTRTGGDHVEALSVNIKLQKLNVLCVNA